MQASQAAASSAAPQSLPWESVSKTQILRQKNLTGISIHPTTYGTSTNTLSVSSGPCICKVLSIRQWWVQNMLPQNMAQWHLRKLWCRKVTLCLLLPFWPSSEIDKIRPSFERCPLHVWRKGMSLSLETQGCRRIWGKKKTGITKFLPIYHHPISSSLSNHRSTRPSTLHQT